MPQAYTERNDRGEVNTYSKCPYTRVIIKIQLGIVFKLTYILGLVD